MFFIFSFDLLVYAAALIIFLVMLAMFPVFTLILTGLIIWVLIASLKERGGAADE